MPETISTSINGKDLKFTVEVEDSALELIRDQAGLTGTKLVCGSGACGACTVLIDGKPCCSCLTPAVQLHKKKVQTIEDHDREGNLHPVQKAFLAKDGLQCGYCTPGFINEGIAFYDHWRKEHGKKRPSREEVAEGLAGHLCRCGAYQGIYEAMQAACAGEFDGEKMPEYSRVDGLGKVTGKATYTTDIRLPGQLVGKIFRSPHPHARISSIDYSGVSKMPGVKAVVRLKEGDILRYDGEPILALAAETEAQAHTALQKVRIEYEILDFVLDTNEARQPKAPLVYPDGHKNLPSAAEGPRFPGKWENNIRKVSLSMTSSKKGRAKRKVAKADPEARTNFSGNFHTPIQLHTSLETHCAVADWREDKLTVYTSTQAVYFLAKDIAKHFKLKEENVEVIAEYIGGAFGSKLTLHVSNLAAIELSKEAGAPVGLIYTRAEEMIDAGYRPGSELEMKIACEPDGSKPVYTLHAYNNGGISTGTTTAEVSGLNYNKGISRKLQDYDVVSNQGAASAFRAPGGPASNFALEQSIDQLAHQLDMDPLDFRRKWEKGEDYQSLFDWIEQLPAWKNKQKSGSQNGRFRKGIGMATAGWFHFYMPSCEVEVAAGPEGIVVRNSVQDMGQGARSVLAAAVAEEFGVTPQEIKVEIGSSHLHIGPTSGGSRTTPTIFPAAREAAQKVKKQMALNWGKQKGWKEVEEEKGGIRHSGGKVTWTDLLKEGARESAKVKRGRNRGLNPMEMIALAQGLVLGKHRSRGAYVVETEVDTLLGKVRITRVWGAMRVGKIHVPPLALSQCYGGIIQGIGHALYEDKSFCPQSGRVLSLGLEDYRVPGIGDIPEMKVDFLEEGFDYAKDKGIGLAEICTIPVISAIANSVYNATGWRPMEAPILPSTVIQGMSV